MSYREEWPLARLNADRIRQERLAEGLRHAWKSGTKSWLDLAVMVLEELKPGRVDADAVFTIELRRDRSQVRTQANWGGEPADLLDRAIVALRAERAALDACPMHNPAPAVAEQTDREG